MDPNDDPTAEHSIDVELVDAFETQSESEALVVKGLLESAGIESALISLEAPPDVLPGVGGFVVRVPADRAAEARRIIAESRDIRPDSPDSKLTDGSAA